MNCHVVSTDETKPDKKTLSNNRIQKKKFFCKAITATSATARRRMIVKTEYEKKKKGKLIRCGNEIYSFD